MPMIPIPWRHVASWSCLACGRCCRGFEVALRLDEWVKILGTYGAVVTEPRVDRLSLRKKPDGTCVFLYRFFDRWICGLQPMKPRACKLWPFKIHGKPKYGRPDEASFTRGEKRLFVYVDPLCPGIRWGAPTQSFMHNTLPEFVEIGLGLREKQQYSTSKISYTPLYMGVQGKRKLYRPPPLV